MKRLTKKVDGAWTAICEYGNPPYPVVTQDVIDRIAAIEDILGDEYDLDELKEVVQAKREERCVVFAPGYPVGSIYYKDVDGNYIQEASGVVTTEEYEAALRREQE